MGGEAVVDLYVYDTLAGGAGYSRLVGDHFKRIFQATIERLSACTCGSSCTHCLRTYANRITHSQLDRNLALDLAQYVLTGAAPTIGTPRAQYEQLLPLLSILRLMGWRTSASATFGAEIERAGSQNLVALRPALVDPGSVPEHWRCALQFSAFEIEKDLPSCLLAIPSG